MTKQQLLLRKSFGSSCRATCPGHSRSVEATHWILSSLVRTSYISRFTPTQALAERFAAVMAAAKQVAQTFKKYTVQPQGVWAKVSSWLQVDSKRSTGVPLNPLFRNPPPASNDPAEYDDPVTIPAGDIAENPYWKRDIRRSYPQLSVVNQGDVVGLLTVGSKAAPKEDVLQIGDAGQKQLVAVQEAGQKTGLPAFFKNDKTNMAAVLGAGGLPPMPSNLGQNMVGKRYSLDAEQSYEDQYPCRSFT